MERNEIDEDIEKLKRDDEDVRKNIARDFAENIVGDIREMRGDDGEVEDYYPSFKMEMKDLDDDLDDLMRKCEKDDDDQSLIRGIGRMSVLDV